MKCKGKAHYLRAFGYTIILRKALCNETLVKCSVVRLGFAGLVGNMKVGGFVQGNISTIVYKGTEKSICYLFVVVWCTASTNILRQIKPDVPLVNGQIVSRYSSNFI